MGLYYYPTMELTVFENIPIYEVHEIEIVTGLKSTKTNAYFNIINIFSYQVYYH